MHMVEQPASLRRYQVNASAWPIEQFLDRPSGAAKFDMDQPYQRGLVWGTKRKQNLVKSILMGVRSHRSSSTTDCRRSSITPGTTRPATG